MTTCRQRMLRGNWAEDLTRLEEGHRCAFPIAPWNTYSNAAYLLAALWVVVTQEGSVRWVLGAALLLLAVGSAGYHGFKTGAWNNADWAGMGATMTVLALNGWFSAAPGVALGAFSLGAVTAVLTAQHMHFDLVMGGLFLVAVIPAYLYGDALLATESVVCFVLAFLCWHLDRKRKFVGVYGHGAWHCFTGAAMALLFAAQAR